MQNLNRRVRGKQGDFTLGELLGQGQFGKVYRGYSSNYPQGVAIKVIRKSKFNRNQKLKSLLEREMEVLSGFKHPNVIELHELINEKNDVYLVYEYCEGGTLEDRITIGEDKLIPLLGEIVEALVQAEKLRIIHRDLKPANILFKKGKIKIADWGFSRLLAHGQTTCSFIGSPAYMAPEVLKNEQYSLKADIWSLGVMLYEALTGNCPWVSSSISNLYMQVLKNPVSFPKDAKISDSMKQLICQMLILAPRNRLSSTQILQKLQKMTECSSKLEKKTESQGQERIMSCVFFLEVVQWGRKQLTKTSKLLLVVRLVQQNLMRLKTTRKDLQISQIWQKQMKVINEMRRKLEAKTLARKKSQDQFVKRQTKTRESDDNPESQWENMVKQSIKYAIQQLEVCYKSMQNKQQRLIELNIILDLIIFPQMPQEYLKIPLTNYLQELQTYSKKTLLKLLNYKLLLINKKYYHE